MWEPVPDPLDLDRSRSRPGPRRLLARFGPFLVVLLAGCSTNREPFYADYWRGDFVRAEERARSWVGDGTEDGKDAVLHLLEYGRVLQAEGRPGESNAAYDQALARMDDYERRAQVSVRDVGSEALATFRNPAALPYRGTDADRIWLHSFKALNELALGDVSGAGVEMRRAQERQRRVREGLEGDQEALDERAAEEGVRWEDLSDQAEVRDLMERWRGHVNPEWAPAENPLATWLGGYIRLLQGDRSEAEVDFARLVLLVPGSTALQEELEYATDPSRHAEPRVTVLFEGGRGPWLEEVKVEIFLPGSGYSGLALPALASDPGPVPSLVVRDPETGTRWAPASLVDSQAVAAAWLADAYPGIVLRTVLSLVVKEAISTGVRHVARSQDHKGKDNGLFEFLAVVATSLAKSALNDADTRLWGTLPAQVQVVSLPAPSSGVLELQLQEGGGPGGARQMISLPDRDRTLIMVRSVHSGHLDVHTVSFDRINP